MYVSCLFTFVSRRVECDYFEEPSKYDNNAQQSDTFGTVDRMIIRQL